MATASIARPDVEQAVVDRIPPLIDLDAHIVEPPDVWSSRLPARYRVGIELLDRVGVDNVTFETDYPQQDGTWPYSREAAAAQFGHLDQAVIDKIARGNAIRLLDLPFQP